MILTDDKKPLPSLPAASRSLPRQSSKTPPLVFSSSFAPPPYADAHDSQPTQTVDLLSEDVDATPQPYYLAPIGSPTVTSSPHSSGSKARSFAPIALPTVPSPSISHSPNTPESHCPAPIASPTTPTPSSLSPDPIPDLRHQNHVRIIRENDNIEKRIVLDLSLPAPPGSGEKALELDSGSNVWCRVYIVGQAGGKRVDISAKSRNGEVMLVVAACPPNTHLAITVSAENGHASVRLPQSFSGPVSLEARNGGPVSVRSGLKAHSRTLARETRTDQKSNETVDVRRLWVGEYASTEAGAEWKGDQCEVYGRNGAVDVGYWEGRNPVERAVAGLVKRVLGVELWPEAAHMLSPTMPPHHFSR